MRQPRSARSAATFSSARSPFVFRGAIAPQAYDNKFHAWCTKVRHLCEFSVVEVEVLRGLLLEPELVVLGGVLEEVGGVLEHVLMTGVRVVVGLWLGLCARLRLGARRRLLVLLGDRLRGAGRLRQRRLERLV